MNRTLILSICFGALCAAPSFAHDEDTITKARHLGISVGKTYSCIAEENRAAARAEFEDMFDMIYDLDGKELAFVFAVGIGYGAAQEHDAVDCENLLPLVNDAKAEFGLEGVR
jgi:hypothetical protein